MTRRAVAILLHAFGEVVSIVGYGLHRLADRLEGYRA